MLILNNFVFFLFLCFFIIPTAFSSTSEVNDMKHYGKCHVWSSVNPLTDQVAHALTCNNCERASILVPRCWENMPGIIFKTGLPDLPKEELVIFDTKKPYAVREWMDVSIRVDNGEIYRGEWLGTSIVGMFINLSSNVSGIHTLLVEMLSGKRVVFHITDKSRGALSLKGSISLDGFAEAFADYESRRHSTKNGS